MIDIAFLMGIIGAAVGIIIGIIIYSEVSDATFAGYSTTITNNFTEEEKLHVGPDVVDWRNNSVGEPTSSSYSLNVSQGDVFAAIEQKYDTNQVSHTGSNAIFGLYDQSNNLLVKTEVKSVPDSVGITTVRFNFEGGDYVIPAGVTSVRGVYLAPQQHTLQGHGIGTITRGGAYTIPNMPDPYSAVGTVCTGCAITHKLINVIENEVQTTFTGRDAAPAEHTRADGIAFTVISIIPISLFFGLFGMFGGFNNRGIS